MDENNKTQGSEIQGFDSAGRGYKLTPEGGFFEDKSAEPAESAPVTVDTPVIPEEPTVEPPEPEVYTAEPEIKNEGGAPTPQKRRYSFGVIVLCAFMAAVIGAVVAFGATTLVYSGNKNTVSTPQNSGGENIVNTTINVDKVAASAIEAVAEKASPAVVGIRTTAAVSNFFGGMSDSQGEGSGVIYSSDGYIITNHHVIESVIGQSSEYAKIEVFLNDGSNKSYSATIIGYNINSDLAVLKIEPDTSLNAIEIGNSDNLKAGQFVAAIGCPGGLDFMGSVSYGIVSGLDRNLTNDDQSVALIQTDAAINPGNSGGALLDIEGKLIGINSSKIASTEYEGMGFAIPVNSVVEICDQIIAKKDDPEPFIGIVISETYDEATLRRLGYPAGAVVSSVVTGGPADVGGIHRGDIITEFAEKEISSYKELYGLINECSVGDKVAVQIYRSGRYYSTTITVSSNNSF